MSNAKNYILKDEDTGLSSSDESMELFNAGQNNSSDVDELQQLLGETFTSEADDSVAPVEDENAVSALEELEEPYDVLHETGEDDIEASLPADESTSEGASDVSSLMEEMTALYGDSVETQIDESDIAVETDESENEGTSDGVSLMEELEKLFSGSTESAETEFSAETSEQFSAEEDASSLSALDELKAFLDETTQDEAANIETSLVSTLEGSYISRRSVLDELETLLQSCITELKADAEKTTSDTPVFTDVEYPSRDELQNLLESILSQLMLFADSAVATTFTDDVSVLDELKSFMDQTGDTDKGTADKTEASTESENLFADDDFAEPYKNEQYESEVNENETDLSDMSDYVAVENGDAEDAGTENTGTDSIIDELNLLLGDSDSDAETEIFDTTLESDYTTSGISDETPVLDEPVQDELDTYMAGLSRDVDAANETAADETAVDTSDTEPVSSSSNTIEELEAMLNEINSSGNDTPDNDKTSEDIIVNEDDFSYEIETRQPFTEVVVDEIEADSIEADNSEANNIEANVSVTHAPAVKMSEVNTSTEKVTLLHEQDNKGRLPIIGLLFVAALVAGIYSIWNLLDTDNGIDDRSEKTRVNRTHKPVAVPEKPKTSARSKQSVIEHRIVQKRQSDAEEKLPQGSILEESPVTVIPAEAALENKATQAQRTEGVYIESENRLKDMIGLQIEKLQQENRNSINQLNRRIAQAELENKATSAQRTEGVYIKSENRLKEMIGLQVDKLQQENNNSIKQLNRRITETELENKATPAQRTEGVYIKSENRLKEMIGLQVDKLQQENSNSIKQLNRRMTKAEAAIALLQEEKTIVKQQGITKPDITGPVKPAPFKVPEKLALSAKQELIELSIQRALANAALAKDRSLWSVHLSAYYGEPPSAAELKYLGSAGISYEIKKAVVNDQVWYRVIVNEFSEYEKAKAYSKDIRKKIGRKDIWISKGQ